MRKCSENSPIIFLVKQLEDTQVDDRQSNKSMRRTLQCSLTKNHKSKSSHIRNVSDMRGVERVGKLKGPIKKRGGAYD